MQHRFILFTGSSPGAGKSTLSRLLTKQLQANGIPVRWMHEEDIVAAFERFVPGMTADEWTPDHFLRGSTALVESCLADNVTVIVDSYLPGFHYLYGRYPETRVETFNVELRSTLNPLQPLVIYLQTDVETALLRGARQRGMAWLDTITRYLNGWQLPHYSDVHKPLRTVPDVISFFTKVDQLAVALLAQWPNTLILNATHQPTGELLTAILRALHLEERSIEHAVSREELRYYTGVYLPDDAASASQPLTLTLVGDALFADVYWPAGTRLMPDGTGRFHLEGTNRHITFQAQAEGTPGELLYSVGETTHRYRKHSEVR